MTGENRLNKSFTIFSKTEKKWGDESEGGGS